MNPKDGSWTKYKKKKPCEIYDDDLPNVIFPILQLATKLIYYSIIL